MAYIRRNTVCRPRDISAPLDTLPQHLQGCTWNVASNFLTFKRETEELGKVQQRAPKMVRGLEHITSMKKLKELGLLSLAKRRIRSNLIATYNSVKESYKNDGVDLFGRGR